MIAMSISQRLYAPFLWLHRQSFLGRVRVMALLLGCFTPVAFWNSSTIAAQVAAIEAGGTTATAVVTKAVYNEKRKRTWVRYAFVDRSGATHDGAQSHLTNGQHLKTGSQIEIVYSTRDPRHSTVDRRVLGLEATRAGEASLAFLCIGLLAMVPYGRIWLKLRPA